MDFKTRLNQALLDKDMTAAELSRLSGIGEGAISQYRSGAYKASQRNLERIANALGVSISWLMGADDDDLPIDNAVRMGDLAADDFVVYPVIGSIAAGYDGAAIEEETGETLQVPRALLNGHRPEDFMVLRVHGNSMSPLLLDGDKAIVKRCTSVDSGSIAVLLYNSDEATIKRVRYVSGEDWLEMIPANDRYQIKRIEGAELEQCRVLGKVVDMMRHFD